MRLLILLFLFFPFIHSDRTITCTNGFTLVNNKCLKLFADPTSRKNATKMCSTFAGNLVTIKSEEENQAVINFIGNSTKRVWIGLYCFQNDPTNCLWDDESGSAVGYNNFAINFPFVEIDNCIFYKVRGTLAGKWLSGDCDEDMRSFVCELPTTFEDDCPLNFNGSCYTPSEDLLLKEAHGYEIAEMLCKRRCGNPVSIHSANEIRFIQNYYESLDRDSILLGGRKKSNSGENFLWLDGSPWNYENFNKQSNPSEVCVKMSLKSNGSRSQGSWYLSDCLQFHFFMCKRPAGIECPVISSSVSKTTPSVITSNCNKFMMISGSFSSPNHPGNYSVFENCSYSLATVGSQRIRLTLSVIKTELKYDFIRVYDGDSRESPLLVAISGSFAEPEYFESSGNTMFVTFHSDVSNNDSGFRASFLSLK